MAAITSTVRLVVTWIVQGFDVLRQRALLYVGKFVHTSVKNLLCSTQRWSKHTARQTGEHDAERTTRAEAPSGCDRQCSTHCQDSDRRNRRDDAETASQAQERFGGREGSSGVNHSRRTQGDCAEGRSSEVGIMAYSIYSVAKTFAEKTDWSLSNLELNKLAYLAHMISLGKSNGQRGLVRNVFEAWDYGPVSPGLYHKAKSFGSDPVGNIFHQYESISDPDDIAIVDEVLEGVGARTPGQLVAITHWESGAWYKNYEPGVRGVIIPDEDILDEYRKRAAPQAA